MRVEAKIRMAADVCLAVLLPVLMAEILTGQKLHEWMGMGMAVLFILHHGLNRKWWGNVGKGGYTLYRCIGAMLNFLMLADILALTVSGIMMSGFVFDGFSISSGMVFSRRLHLFASHWGFILISLHMGLHWNMALNLADRRKKGKCPDRLAVWFYRGIAAAAALFGTSAFIRQNMADYLFLRTAFVFWDETKSAGLFFIEILAMMELFTAIGYYGSNFLKGRKSSQMKQKALKSLAFLLPVFLCAAVIIWFGFGNKMPASDLWDHGAENSSGGEMNEDKKNSKTNPFKY